ncbi:MAG TPA: adenylyltransferase/cytidyltransferase family protein [Spirochaetales bacterium]|nr:adenylyltransferase/cytidyltransferase family protein [Spirochaetales bacterium]HRY55185.1 adenylyltransferase/cytidyltransferase family protein [Spirochaetia bacterium]HRZ63592.1 adenylyltransferase/cytidyltransferase family protein [Spirochaetia bacterium]
MSRAFVSGAFDDIRSRQIRFLEEASRLGSLTVCLWPDEAVARVAGAAPKFGLAERRYFLESMRFVDRVLVAPEALDPDTLELGAADPGVAGAAGAAGGLRGAAWVLPPEPAPPGEGPSAAKLAFCARAGLEPRALRAAELGGFPYEAPPYGAPIEGGRPRVIVTGCFDWFHSGHARFFEEAAAYGELNVVIGSDENLRLLKGEGHPLFPAEERRYVAASMRSAARVLVASGSGWLDAEPEIVALGASRYVVNEDGDKPEKRRYCERQGIEYIVLKRSPKEGLPRRASTDLRGF